MTINPRSTLDMFLLFRPAQTQAHAFDLKLMLQTQLSVPVEPLVRPVTAEGEFPLLILSKTAVDFETRIVIKSNSTLAAPYEAEVFIRNNDSADRKVTLGEPRPVGGGKVATGVWRLEPNVLDLEAGEGAHVRILFRPTDAVKYDYTARLLPFLARRPPAAAGGGRGAGTLRTREERRRSLTRPSFFPHHPTPPPSRSRSSWTVARRGTCRWSCWARASTLAWRSTCARRCCRRSPWGCPPPRRSTS